MGIGNLPLITVVSAAGAVVALGIAYFRKHRLNKVPIVRAPYTEGEFPDEIYQQIFSHLQPEDLSRCSRVCRTWNVLTKSPELWTQHDCRDAMQRPDTCSRPGCIWCSLYTHARNLTKLCGINPLADEGYVFESSPATKPRLPWFRIFHYTAGLAATAFGVWASYQISNLEAVKASPYLIPFGMALGFMNPSILGNYPKLRKSWPAITACLGVGKCVYDLVVYRQGSSWGLELLFLAAHYSQTGRTLVVKTHQKLIDFLCHERFEFLYSGPTSIIHKVFIAANVLLWGSLLWFFPMKTIVGWATWGCTALLTSLTYETMNSLSWFYFAAITMFNFRMFSFLAGLPMNLTFLGLVAGFAGSQICLDSTQLLSIPYLAAIVTFIVQSPSQENRICWILLLIIKLFFQKMFHQPVRDVRLLPCQFLLNKLYALLSFRTKQKHRRDGPISFEGTDLDTSAYDSMRAVQSVRTRWLRGSLQATHLRRDHPLAEWSPNLAEKSDGVCNFAPKGTRIVYSRFQSPLIRADRVLLVPGDRLLAFTSNVVGVSVVKLLAAYSLSELASCQIPSDAFVSASGKYFVAASKKVQLFDLDSLTLIGEVPVLVSAHTAAVAVNSRYVAVATGEAVYTYQIATEEDNAAVNDLDPMSRKRTLVIVGRFPFYSLKLAFSVHTMQLSSDGVLFLLNKTRRVVTAFDITTMQRLYERKHVSDMGLLAGGSVVVLMRKDRFEILDPTQKQTMRKIEIENGLTPSTTDIGTPIDTSFGAGRYHFGYDYILYSNPCESDRHLECFALMLKADHVQ